MPKMEFQETQNQLLNKVIKSRVDQNFIYFESSKLHRQINLTKAYLKINYWVHIKAKPVLTHCVAKK